MFNINLGVRVRSRVTGITGIITARSENLYGCDRYYIQPPVGTDNKVPEGWWIDEHDVEFIDAGVSDRVVPASLPSDVRGGPMSRSS